MSTDAGKGFLKRVACAAAVEFHYFECGAAGLAAIARGAARLSAGKRILRANRSAPEVRFADSELAIALQYVQPFDLCSF